MQIYWRVKQVAQNRLISSKMLALRVSSTKSKITYLQNFVNCSIKKNIDEDEKHLSCCGENSEEEHDNVEITIWRKVWYIVMTLINIFCNLWNKLNFTNSIRFKEMIIQRIEYSWKNIYRSFSDESNILIGLSQKVRVHKVIKLVCQLGTIIFSKKPLQFP